MFSKVDISDSTKEATVENTLSKNLYLKLVTHFKLHSSRLKSMCSWILVHLLPFMQLATHFLLDLQEK